MRKSTAPPIGKVLFAYELWRQYGTVNCGYRLLHAMARRSGLLKCRFAARPWDQSTLESFCLRGVPTDAQDYQRYREAVSCRFFWSPGNLPELEEDWKLDATGKADAILAGRLTYFSSQSAILGFPFSWFTNPFTGQTADASRHWCDRDEFEADQGDIRFLWEPSRFAWAYDLVRAYAATRDDSYSEGFWRLVESWRAANPPNMGPNWQCGQECALRVLAICFGVFGLWESSASSPTRIKMIAEIIAAHGHRIYRNIRYARTQMGNHAVSEAAALYTIGILFPEFSRSELWRRRGLGILEDEVRRHNYQDGSYAQHSMNYHRLMLQLYLWVLRLAELNGQRFSPDVMTKLDKATQFLYHLQDEASGRVPNYGPNDGSLIFPIDSCDFLDYRPAIGAMHYQLQRKRLYEHGPWDEDLVWLFGSKGEEEQPVIAPRRSRSFDDGGYYCLRGHATWGMVRCHSFRNRPNQADLLHLDVWWRGTNVLRDSGTYSYNAPEPWRDWFTSTAAHNTVELAGQDQMVKVQRFSWVHLARAAVRLVAENAEQNIDYFEGEHYGDKRLPSKAVHRRAILRCGETHWVIIDDVHGHGSEVVRLYWQLADAQYAPRGNTVTLSTRAGNVFVTFLCKGAAEVFGVSRATVGCRPEGWESLNYGQKVPAPSLCAGGAFQLPCRLITVVGLGVNSGPTYEAETQTVRWSNTAANEARLSDLGDKSSIVLMELRKGTEKLVLRKQLRH